MKPTNSPSRPGVTKCVKSSLNFPHISCRKAKTQIALSISMQHRKTSSCDKAMDRRTDFSTQVGLTINFFITATQQRINFKQNLLTGKIVNRKDRYFTCRSQSREIGLVRGLHQWMPLSAMSLMHCKSESTVHFHKIQRQFFSYTLWNMTPCRRSEEWRYRFMDC
jgi:hypothetical protein